MLADWLVQCEARFGGLQKTPLTCLSPYDERSKAQKLKKRKVGSQGGDRMGWHGYAPAYAEALAEKFGSQIPIRGRVVIVELGVLLGTGLAMWCELFPEARVIGLDLDTAPYQANQLKLRKLGAFASNSPEVHQFDELAPDAGQRLGQILGNDRVDVFIDDAAHYDGAVLRAFAMARPYLASDALYFIEDNKTAANKLNVRHTRAGLLTVARP